MQSTSFINYLQYEKRYSNQTIKAYKVDLSQFLLFLKEFYQIDKDPQKVTHTHIRSWLVELVNKNIAARSISRKLSTLKTYFRFLQKKGVCSSNPATNVSAPKSAFRLPKILEADQVEQLLDEHHFGTDFEGYRNRLIVELFFETGMRLSELLSLSLSSFDLKTQTIKIVGKGNKERILSFSNRLHGTFKEYVTEAKKLFAFADRDAPLLLTKKGKPIYPKLVHRLLAQKLAWVTTSKHTNPHVLRHTFATTLLNNGADLNSIKELLGHSSLAATQVYTHNSIEKIKNIYKKTHPKSSE